MTTFTDALLGTVDDEAVPLDLGQQGMTAINMPPGRCGV